MTETPRRTVLRTGALAVSGLAVAGQTAAQPDDEEPEEPPINAKGATVATFDFADVSVTTGTIGTPGGGSSTGTFSGTAHTVFKPKNDDTALIQLSFKRTSGEWLTGPLAGTVFCHITLNSAKTVGFGGDESTQVSFRALSNPCRGQRTALEGPLITTLTTDGSLTLQHLHLEPRNDDEGDVVR